MLGECFSAGVLGLYGGLASKIAFITFTVSS
jgi:hypothetical protein